MSTACSALCARCVRPSFIFVILASGSCGFIQSSFEPFFFRLRSIRARILPRRRPDAGRLRERRQKLLVALAGVAPHDDRSAALASSVVASTPIVLPFSSFFLGRHSQHPREHRLVRLQVDQPPRPRNRRVIGRRVVHRQAQEVAQGERIRRPPRDPALGVDALEVADQQQPEVDARRQTRTAHRVGVERRRCARRTDRSRPREEARSGADRTGAPGRPASRWSAPTAPLARSRLRFPIDMGAV